MIKFFSFVLTSLVLASGTALCAESTNGNISIDEKSVEDVPEPIKCYSFVGDVSGNEKMPVGLAVQLCAGTRNAKATLVCYKMSFETPGLNRGLAIELYGREENFNDSFKTHSCKKGRPNPSFKREA